MEKIEIDKGRYLIGMAGGLGEAYLDEENEISKPAYIITSYRCKLDSTICEPY